jgi:hypothetical protein
LLELAPDCPVTPIRLFRLLRVSLDEPELPTDLLLANESLWKSLSRTELCSPLAATALSMTSWRSVSLFRICTENIVMIFRKNLGKSVLYLGKLDTAYFFSEEISILRGKTGMNKRH